MPMLPAPETVLAPAESPFALYVPWTAPPSLAASDLRAAVSARVHTLRDAGLPPEKVVIAIKTVASDLEKQSLLAAASLELGLLRAQELRSRMVRWAIEAYFSP